MNVSSSKRSIAELELFPVFYFLLAALVVGLYVGVSYAQNGDFGFPLDDAWIHQVYARNLGTRFEFSFFAGQPSAGSTSPLWALLLGVGYLLRIDFRVWTVLLGVFFLSASGWATRGLMQGLTDEARAVNWFAPVFVVVEWHMVWAAASGMEIVLFVFLGLGLVALLLRSGARNGVLIGVVAGLLTSTRPEGVILAGLVGVGLMYEERRKPASAAALRKYGSYALAWLVLILPYVWFNVKASGTILPNTFYAKGAEYAELTTGTNFFVRWLEMYRQPLIGAQLLLMPGLVYAVYVLVRGKEWVKVLPALWILILPALYAWRLPVEYQFGRYMMPILPFVIVYGIVGTVWLMPKIPLRLLRRAWGLTIVALAVVFLWLGAPLYAQSVGIINCEMVTAAKWTRANLRVGDVVAAHDIGAQEYFDPRQMLDMAGLVSPEVIPFIRDEAKLKDWIVRERARYVIFFPSWYPKLAKDVEFTEVYSTDCAGTREMGEENLRVYVVE